MRRLSLLIPIVIVAVIVGTWCGCKDEETGTTSDDTTTGDTVLSDGDADNQADGEVDQDEADQNEVLGDVEGDEADTDDAGDASEEPVITTRVVWGDTHVHTRYSLDAFGGMAIAEDQLDKPRDVFEACLFGRHCSRLDFMVSSEHAEFMTPTIWDSVRNEVRECNAVVGELSGESDFFAFTGFEWTQRAETPSNPRSDIGDSRFWGHKNVFFLGTDDSELPPRPISSAATPDVLTTQELERDPLYLVFSRLDEELAGTEVYPADEYRSLPELDICTDDSAEDEDCFEVARTPEALFSRLHELGLPTIVGAHGTAWPLGGAGSYAEQVNRTQHDGDLQVFVEVYSKHGSSEEFRDWAPAREWRTVARDEPCEEGDHACQYLCVEPPADQAFIPCCWRMVEIVMSREVCTDDIDSVACQTQIASARRDGELFESEEGDDWLDCDQCPDCFQPAARFQMFGAIQDGLARVDRSGDDPPLGFDVGFLGSNDTHFAAPGSVREIAAFAETHVPDVAFALSEAQAEVPPISQSIGYYYPGGIAGVHVPLTGEVDRETVFDAIKNRHIFATTGPRIQLWFQLVNGPEGEAPQGSTIRGFTDEPQFWVKAIGAPVEVWDCPDSDPTGAVGYDDFYTDVCRDSCYAEHPTDRMKIIRLEVVRVRRQDDPSTDIDIASLIDDPWLEIPCGEDEAGLVECEAAFEDEDFDTLGRDAVYYVRAIQEASVAINGDPSECVRDEDTGRCLSSNYCDLHADYSGMDVDENPCLAEINERAWSSPIYLWR